MSDEQIIPVELTEEERQATDRNGRALFDKETGEALMDTIYYLGFGDAGADMSSTRRTTSGTAKEITREKKAFSWEEMIAGVK